MISYHMILYHTELRFGKARVGLGARSPACELFSLLLFADCLLCVVVDVDADC